MCKQAEDNSLILRMFNPIDHKEDIVLNFGQKITSTILCNMDEREKTLYILRTTQFLAIPPKNHYFKSKVECVI